MSFPIERVQTPTYADLYCAGFISKQILPDANFVAGGLQTPTTTKFATRRHGVPRRDADTRAGAEYEDRARTCAMSTSTKCIPGQKKLLKETGQPYEEVGRVQVIDTRSKTAIAQIEYACDGVNPGDTTIPFAEKPTLTFHTPMHFDRFLPASSKVSGRIVMGKDFDSELGTGPEGLPQRRLEPGREDRRLLPRRALLRSRPERSGRFAFIQGCHCRRYAEESSFGRSGNCSPKAMVR